MDSQRNHFAISNYGVSKYTTMNQASEEISIVIPAHNEARRLPATLDVLGDFLKDYARSVEVVVVDDASSDGTGELARAHAVRPQVIRNPEQMGKGATVRRGMLESRGTRVRLFMDADLSVPVRFVEIFCAAVESGEDVVIASRRLAESRIVKKQPLLRQVGSRYFNVALRAAGLTRSRDTQCGFKAFRAEMVEGLFHDSVLDGFLFDVELLVRARLLGYSIAELPVEWEHKGGSTVGPIRCAPDILAEFLYLLRLKRGASLKERG
ncbi:MAG: dolichyl-phosphate beta-glucosyltransferase [Chthoniobacterales bacterium]